MDQWKNKIAIVTGASSGIGAKIAEDLVKHGMQVVALARRADRLNELHDRLTVTGYNRDTTGKLHPHPADVTKEDDILAAFSWIRNNLSSFGGCAHVLVHSAGVYVHESLSSGSTESWRRILETNVLSACIATREAIKDMRTHNISGHIVFINSIAGHSVVAGSIGLYGPSKYAITSLTETLRRELAAEKRKIKITSISPCLVDTEMNADLKQNFLNDLPFLNAKDISDSVLYVLGTPPNVQVEELTIKATGVPF